LLTDGTTTTLHLFNVPLSGTTSVSRYQKGKTSLDSLEQEMMSSSGISWAICKSAPRPRQITMPTSHHSDFYRPDALPAAQPTVSKHWRLCLLILIYLHFMQLLRYRSCLDWEIFLFLFVMC